MYWVLRFEICLLFVFCYLGFINLYFAIWDLEALYYFT
ncbi:hypothetical protein D1AOALGA4SA_12347 [Olavius algarvensis Delta 1 endosymbiont]|nr:hypothetical protein D1AOALGA4SA_12347 [Olavius algarvensis Delta 1 endosymbiont]